MIKKKFFLNNGVYAGRRVASLHRCCLFSSPLFACSNSTFQRALIALHFPTPPILPLSLLICFYPSDLTRHLIISTHNPNNTNATNPIYCSLPGSSLVRCTTTPIMKAPTARNTSSPDFLLHQSREIRESGDLKVGNLF